MNVNTNALKISKRKAIEKYSRQKIQFLISRLYELEAENTELKQSVTNLTDQLLDAECEIEKSDNILNQITSIIDESI